MAMVLPRCIKPVLHSFYPLLSPSLTSPHVCVQYITSRITYLCHSDYFDKQVAQSTMLIIQSLEGATSRLPKTLLYPIILETGPPLINSIDSWVQYLKRPGVRQIFGSIVSDPRMI